MDNDEKHMLHDVCGYISENLEFCSLNKISKHLVFQQCLSLFLSGLPAQMTHSVKKKRYEN